MQLAIVKLIARWVSRRWQAVGRLMQGPPPSKALFCILLFFGGLLLYAVSLMTPPGCDWGSWLCYLLGVERKESVVRGLGIAVAGMLSIWAVWIAHRRAEEMKKQTDVAHRTVCATEERLVQERFRDAVEHLGHASESVRLNGAYALFRLAVREEAFREWVARTLCLHIVTVTRAEEYREANATAPSAEIEILMRLLFEEKSLDSEGLHSEAEREAFREGFLIDLSRGHFPGLVLKHARFQGADLLHARFQGAYLESAEFQEADLLHAQFQGASSSEEENALFKWRMKERIGRETDVSGTVFAGGLERKEVERMAEKLRQASGRVSEEEIQAFEQRLGKHIGREASHALPDKAQSGTYDEAQAREWIEEYEKARKVYKQAIM